MLDRCRIAGSPALHFGIFVAFATIYPRVELLLRIQAKWVALILAAIYTLQLLAYHAWSDLVVVWTSIGVAFLFVELNGAGPELAWWNAVNARFASPPKYHVLPKPRARTSGSRSESEDVYTSIDPILDKISKFGIGSLTASERRQLDRERERLLGEVEHLRAVTAIDEVDEYVARDLVVYVDGHYRTIPERSSRGLAGASMGGYGAFKLALTRPEGFPGQTLTIDGSTITGGAVTTRPDRLQPPSFRAKE